MESWWKWKKEHVLPMVMREQSVDVWILRNNEADLYYNNEGPVFTSLLPANFEGMTLPSIYAHPGSQAIPKFLLFHYNNGRIEYHEPSDFKHINTLVNKIQPNRIAISFFNNEDMLNALGKKYSKKIIDSWTIGVRWLETISPGQIDAYSFVQGLANDIIAEGFSNAVVIPGITTTDDLNWWFRHCYLDLDLEIENHPSVIVKRRPSLIEKYSSIDSPNKFRDGQTQNGINVVIQKGDIISLDSDIMLMGLVTDSHQHAYVLQSNEEDVPDDLKKALETVNQMQDLFAAEFRLGRTGKEIVASSKKIELLPGIIETELGFHPPPMFIRRFLLGGYMFSHKTYVAGMTSGPGYYPTSIVTNNHNLYHNTLYAFEPHTRIDVEGWGPIGVEIGIGQIVVFSEVGVRYLNRPQNSKWHVIK
jgi:hypothetical protein|tara:strand:- start:1185 stop:2438 length:1254 start_codon:yes stop_codon:yes gene_type:complete